MAVYRTIGTMLILAVTGLILAGCKEDVPNAEEALKEAQSRAENAVAIDHFKVKNLVRDNGWMDNGRYKIRFNWELETVASFGEIIHKFAMQNEGWFDGLHETERNVHLLSLFPIEDKKSSRARGDAYNARLEAYCKVKKALCEYIFVSDQETMAKRYALALMGANWLQSTYGIPDNAPAGHVVTRSGTLSYIKSEKGWMVE